MAGAIASLRPFTGTKDSPCELKHNARTGSERFLDTACEQWHTACQKRSASISACAGAGNSGVYALACWVSILPVAANTTALHLLDPISMASKLMMVFGSCLLRNFSTIATIHRNVSVATENFRPRVPDSTTSTLLPLLLLGRETLDTPRNVSGTSNNNIRNRT